MTQHLSLLLVVSWLALGAAACARAEPPTPAAESHKAMPAVDAPDGHFSGEVAARLEAGTYTYLRVRTDTGGERWVVTLGAGAPVGSAVRVVNMGTRRDFHSKRLDRTFDDLVFGIVRTST